MPFPVQNAVPVTENEKRVKRVLNAAYSVRAWTLLAQAEIDTDRNSLRSLIQTSTSYLDACTNALDAMTAAEIGVIAEQLDGGVAARGWANVAPSLNALRTTVLPAFIAAVQANPADVFRASAVDGRGNLVFGHPLPAGVRTDLLGYYTDILAEFA